jgi:hypothetical protein
MTTEPALEQFDRPRSTYPHVLGERISRQETFET